MKKTDLCGAEVCFFAGKMDDYPSAFFGGKTAEKATSPDKGRQDGVSA
jgi:hypothetical protein